MRFDPTDRPFGVAPSILVEAAAHLRGLSDGFSADDFCRAVGAPAREAMPVLRAMTDAGYFEEKGERLFTPTTRANQLALASIGPGLARTNAERLLQQVVERAAAINADPVAYPYSVQALAVFGSYLTDKPVLGDLDIAVKTRTQPRAPGQRIANFHEALERDAASRRKTFAAPSPPKAEGHQPS